MRVNMEGFTWTSYKILEVSPKIACHRLNVDKSAKPMIQIARRPTLVQVQAIKKRRERVAIWMGAYQQQLARAYNKKVNLREFLIG